MDNNSYLVIYAPVFDIISKFVFRVIASFAITIIFYYQNTKIKRTLGILSKKISCRVSLILIKSQIIPF